MHLSHLLARFAVLAVLAVAAALPAAANENQAVQVVRQLEREGLSLAQPGMPLAQKEDRFRGALRAHFDLPSVARFVLGRHWNAASEAERRNFVALFEDVTTQTWARRFSDYQGSGLDVLGVQPAPGGGYAVQSVVKRAQGQPIPVTWRLAETGRGLKVVDIVVEGVSMAITHRSEYASVLRTAGMSGLLGAMQNQVAQAR